MKKLMFLFVVLATVIFSSCSNSLPRGKASTVKIMDGSSWRNLGSGQYEYVTENTVKFIRDDDGETYYLNTDNLIYIIEEGD